MLPVVSLRPQKAEAVSCDRVRLQYPASFRGIFQYLSLWPYELCIPSPKQSSMQSPTLLGDAPFNQLLCKSKHSLFSFPSIITASAT